VCWYFFLAEITAIGHINEAIDRNNPRETLACLKLPSAGLQFVNDKQMIHYQQLLAQIKSEKAEVTDTCFCCLLSIKLI